MKRILIFLVGSVLIFSCTDDKGKLLTSKTWELTRVDGNFKDGTGGHDIDAFRDKSKYSKEDLHELYFFADIWDGFDYRQERGKTGNCVFNLDHSLTDNNGIFSQNGGLTWNLEKSTLTIESHSIYLEKINEKEMILSKKISNLEFKYFFTGQ